MQIASNAQTKKASTIESIEFLVNAEMQRPKLTMHSVNRNVTPMMTRKDCQTLDDIIDTSGEASSMSKAIKTEIIKGIESAM
jgi:hypothetical protein